MCTVYLHITFPFIRKIVSVVDRNNNTISRIITIYYCGRHTFPNVVVRGTNACRFRHFSFRNFSCSFFVGNDAVNTFSCSLTSCANFYSASIFLLNCCVHVKVIFISMILAVIVLQMDWMIV